MPLRNDHAGYGSVTKALHWLTVAALAAQFLIGYAMDRNDDLLEGVVDRWLGGEEERLLLVHAALGVSILVLAAVRLAWRSATPLPPWHEGLSAFERRLVPRVEKVLYWTLLLIPLTGLALVLGSGEEWDVGGREWRSPWELADDDALLTAHIATHLVFFGALAIHLGLVVKHQVIDRDRYLQRML